MICAAVTIHVHPGKADAYEAMCRELLPKVRANEPGILFFDIGKCVGRPDTFKVIEIYRDTQASADHHETEYFKAARPVMTECIASIEVETYDSLA